MREGGGQIGRHDPGIRNAKPMNRKLCKTRRGRNASGRSRRRSRGQRYCFATIAQAMNANPMLTKK